MDPTPDFGVGSLSTERRKCLVPMMMTSAQEVRDGESSKEGSTEEGTRRSENGTPSFNEGRSGEEGYGKEEYFEESFGQEGRPAEAHRLQGRISEAVARR